VKEAIAGLSSAFNLLLIFLCSLIQTLILTQPPNNALLANMDVWQSRVEIEHYSVAYFARIASFEAL